MTEWLDVVPRNKIIGFGGDYRIADMIYGHQQMARENIAAALSKVSEKRQRKAELDYLVETARMLLVSNPAKLYGLKY